MASLDDLPVLVREAVPTDMDLVYDSWLRSYRYGRSTPTSGDRPCSKCGQTPRADVRGGAENAEMRGDDYYRLQRQRIVSLLRVSKVMVVHGADTPNVVRAWACLSMAPEVLHYVYTVSLYRRRGYAKMLVEGRTICTHMTDTRRPDSFAMWKWRMGMRYMPHLLDVTG
jgi:hypothetical protein